MILECPACQARYAVPDGAIGPGGRAVRCAKCGHSWREVPRPELAEETPPPVALDKVQEPEVSAPPPEPEPAPPVEEAIEQRSDWAEEPAAPAAPAWRRWALPLGLIALLLAAAAVAALAIGPDTLRTGFGLAARGSSVALLLEVPRKPERRTLASGNELFALTGRVVNPTRERQTVPDIQAELQDAQGRVVYNWIITPPTRTLPPGAAAEFNSAEVDVPKGARELKLSFVGARS